MFLTTSDLDGTIYPEIKQAIARGQTDIINMHINEALSTIQNYLIKKYDIVAELAKQGDARHPLLLKYAKDIAVYYLYDLPETIPAKRVKAFDDAKLWLRDVSSGMAVLAGVEPAPVDDSAPVGGNIQMGSSEKRKNEW